MARPKQTTTPDVDLTKKTVAEIKVLLKKRGIDFKGVTRKADLIALLAKKDKKTPEPKKSGKDKKAPAPKAKAPKVQTKKAVKVSKKEEPEEEEELEEEDLEEEEEPEDIEEEEDLEEEELGEEDLEEEEPEEEEEEPEEEEPAPKAKSKSKPKVKEPEDDEDYETANENDDTDVDIPNKTYSVTAETLYKVITSVRKTSDKNPKEFFKALFRELDTKVEKRDLVIQFDKDLNVVVNDEGYVWDITGKFPSVYAKLTDDKVVPLTPADVKNLNNARVRVYNSQVSDTATISTLNQANKKFHLSKTEPTETEPADGVTIIKPSVTDVEKADAIDVVQKQLEELTTTPHEVTRDEFRKFLSVYYSPGVNRGDPVAIAKKAEMDTDLVKNILLSFKALSQKYSDLVAEFSKVRQPQPKAFDTARPIPTAGGRRLLRPT